MVVSEQHKTLMMSMSSDTWMSRAASSSLHPAALRVEQSNRLSSPHTMLRFLIHSGKFLENAKAVVRETRINPDQS